MNLFSFYLKIKSIINKVLKIDEFGLKKNIKDKLQDHSKELFA